MKQAINVLIHMRRDLFYRVINGKLYSLLHADVWSSTIVLRTTSLQNGMGNLENKTLSVTLAHSNHGYTFPAERPDL